MNTYYCELPARFVGEYGAIVLITPAKDRVQAIKIFSQQFKVAELNVTWECFVEEVRKQTKLLNNKAVRIEIFE